MKLKYLAGIFAFFTSGTNEALMQIEFIAQSSAAQLVFAVIVAHNRNINFLKKVFLII